MAMRRAVASGNWSDPATWDGGTTIPGNGDTVYSNGNTVTIDQNVEIGDVNNVVVNAGSFVAGQYYQITETGTTSFTSIGAGNNNVGTRFRATGVGSGTGKAITTATITNESYGSAAAGGAFTVTSGTYNIWADTRPANNTLLTCSVTSNCTVVGTVFSPQTTFNIITIIFTGSGNHTLVGSIVNGGYRPNNAVVSVTGSCGFVMTGNITAMQSAGLGISTSGSVNITGTSNGGITQGAVGVSFSHTSGAKVLIGNCVAGTAYATEALNNASSGSVIIYGNAFGSGSTAITNDHTLMSPGVRNSSSGTITLSGNTYAGATAPGYIGFSSTSGVNIINGGQYANINGMPAVLAYKMRTGSALSNAEMRFASDGLSTFSYAYSSDYSGFDLPSASNVRYGVAYAGESQVGTCHVPAASSVASGVPVDNTVGTAVLTPESVQAIVGAAVAAAVTSD